MTDVNGLGNGELPAINLLKVLSLKRVLVLIKVLTAAAIVLELVYFVAATLVHRNGLPAAINRLGTAAYGIASAFVLYGIAHIIDRFRKK